MFGIKKKQKTYDKETQQPMMRISICTGEKVVGFTDKTTGKFSDVMLVRDDGDLEAFCKEYGVDKADIGRMW